jgi:hypothetical protein
MAKLPVLEIERRQLGRQYGSMLTGPENLVNRPVQRILREQV